MSGLRRWGRVAVLAAALPFSGCASAFSGYDLAPNGLPRPEAELRQRLADAPASIHEAVVDGEQPLPDDDLLRLLYAGTTARYAGRYLESGQYLDVASYVAEDRVTTSVSRQALSFITSDRALAYVPGRTERLMIPYMAAVDYLQAGDLDAAVVEARRIEALLDRLDEDTAPAEIPGQSRFLHQLAGIIFEAAGETNAAVVAYRRAAGGAPAPDPLPGPVPGDTLGEVVVLVERGFVPHRVEQSVAVVLPPAQAEMLREGDVGERAAAAADAAARILRYASARYGRSAYRAGGRPSSLHLAPWDDCGSGTDCGDGDPYLLRIAWPVLYRDPDPGGEVRIRVGDIEATTTHRFDVGDGVRADFDEQRVGIVARTVLRAATKMVLSESAEKVVSEENEAAGQIVGLLVNLGTLLTERADTRSWHLLPGAVELVRVPLPPGNHTLRLEAGRGRAIDVGPVEVRAGDTSFAVARVWR